MVVIQKLSRLAFLASALILEGCATSSDVGYVWLGTGVDNDWGTGGEIWSHISSFTPQKVEQAGKSYCAKRGLSEPMIHSPVKRGEFYTYRFECSKSIQSNTLSSPPPLPTNNNATPPVSNAMSFDEAKLKCGNLGFQPGTESFGKCVLQLTK